LNFRSLTKSPEKLILALVGLALGLTGLGIFLALRPPQAGSPSVAPASPNATPAGNASTSGSAAAGTAISALGRLEPGGEVFCVSPPSAAAGGRVMKLMAKEGDIVKQNQVIAVMDTYDRLVAAGIQAEAQVREAEARVAQAATGAKQEDLGAQESQINARRAAVGSRQAALVRAQAALETAKGKFKRYEDNKDGISRNDYDQQRLELATAEAAVVQAQRELEQAVREAEQQLKAGSGLANVRPVDVQSAQAGLQVAMAGLQRAKADLETAAVRSPIAGRVLKIHAKETEQVSSLVSGGGTQTCNGIAEVGRTDQMYAVAEVYESDVAKIRTGQKATVTSAAFSETLSGTVDRIGLKVGKKDVLNTDPAADTDARVVEVKVRLADSKPVEGLTNLQVKVEIQP
jgi:HlyD family secretion protein